ncbi:transglutaminase-like domain-containing protein [Sphingosinicella rhizophila]|uniref:Transglutaminase family protein n=1 Tax=Sphingosinicella rhizophila TaxID=3050082 RepID=A0ABU3QA48_9SPHN|nr:transglutaminase family protein [Sphingosinicella sp. GR2756]MDT9600279.1 transglutaminase family protein [Sphingosinicella sp. GR2756]
MLIRAGYDICYEADTDTPMMAMLNLHPSRNKDLRTPQRIFVDPDIPIYDFLDAYGNMCTRLTVPKGGVTLSCDFTIEDSGLPDPVARDAVQHRIEDLPDDVLMFLLGSRYCETDRLSDTAWSLFGHIDNGWDKVQAIVDFTHNHISFGYQYARPTKTAWDAHQEQKGVCRDFAHLAITLCRCMNIPARYCFGYLGDIGVPPADAPMDFSAWFDVYLGGAWHAFDARHNRPRIGRILMARGRDATDTALTTSFGPTRLVRFDVHTDEVTEPR